MNILKREDIIDKFNNAMTNIVKSGAANSPFDMPFLSQIYFEMWGIFPHIVTVGDDGYYLNKSADSWLDDDFEENDEYSEDNIEDEIYTYKNVNFCLTMINMHDYYKANDAYIMRRNNFPVIFANKKIIFYSQYDRDIFILQDTPELSAEDKNCVVDNNQEDKRWFSYITNSGQGFNSTAMKVKEQEVDLNTNYNDDLPHEKIVNFLKSNQSGLILLYGNPGTGKSSYIRYLIHSLKGRQFMVLDSSSFRYITDASFIDLLSQNKNAVIILEDCEDMLADRINGNDQLKTLLNLSDGIIGDSFNFKFICTFNANIAKLDEAILRKGRLKQKYEFKTLTEEKTKKLAEKLGKDIPDGQSLTLAEIYNYNETNGTENKAKRIGFSK